MDLVRELGTLALASRLRRLADRLQQDVSHIYDEQGFDLPARCFPLLVALQGATPTPVTHLARSLGLTHTAIRQMAIQMSRLKLLITERDPNDSRRRLLSLSRKGRSLAKRLTPLWNEIAAANQDLLDSSGHPLLDSLGAIEEQLDRRSIYSRIHDRLNIVIVDFRPEHVEAFRRLNYQWLDQCFEIEEPDRTLLDDPQGQVIERGGVILCALDKNLAPDEEQVVGVCALQRHPGNQIQLTKMAVAPSHRRRGIGRRLIYEATERSQQLGATRLFLLTSPKLEAALALYRSLGFEPTKSFPSRLATLRRPSIALALNLVLPNHS